MGQIRAEGMLALCGCADASSRQLSRTILHSKGAAPSSCCVVRELSGSDSQASSPTRKIETRTVHASDGRRWLGLSWWRLPIGSCGAGVHGRSEGLLAPK
jgi:hypothetical protein